MLKILVLGCPNVGKTSLMERYVTDKFTGIRRATIGTDFRSKKLTINETDVTLQIWDTAGQERFTQGSTLPNSFYRGANGALLVYDVNNDKSYDQMIMWHDEISQRKDDNDYFPIVVIGNKIDIREKLEESIRVDQSSILTWCRDQSYGHVETSAKEGIGVQAGMQVIAGLALEKYVRVTSDPSTKTRTKSNVRVSEMFVENKSGFCSSC